MNALRPFEQAVRQVMRSRLRLLRNLRELVESTEASIGLDGSIRPKSILESVLDGDALKAGGMKNPIGRELFGMMLEEVLQTQPEWSLQIAIDLEYNVTSVKRWRAGDSCPHRALWPTIFEWLKKALDDRISKFQIQ